MADSVHYQRVVNHSSKDAKARKDARGRALRRILGLVISVLIIILIAELIFHFAIAPRLELRSVQLDSDMDISLEEVKLVGGIAEGELFYTIDEASIAARIEALPDVKSASVRRLFPDSLGVSISGRKPLGILMVESDGVVFPAMIDRDGVVFRIGLEIDDWSLPLIRGVEFEEFYAGVQMKSAYRQMLADLQRLNQQSPELLRAFSEFRIEETYPGIFEWILVPIHLPVRVRASVGLDREQGLYILKILDVLAQSGLEGISEIDFRTGDVVYSSEGGSDGIE
jgi:cell division septal protein FtsQ